MRNRLSGGEIQGNGRVSIDATALLDEGRSPGCRADAESRARFTNELEGAAIDLQQLDLPHLARIEVGRPLLRCRGGQRWQPSLFDTQFR